MYNLFWQASNKASHPTTFPLLGLCGLTLTLPQHQSTPKSRLLAALCETKAMAHEIETERLNLSQLTSINADDFRKLVTNGEVTKYCFDPLTETEVNRSFESRIKPWDTKQNHWLTLAVYLNDTKEFIGVNGFRNTSNQKEVEVGFMFFPEFHGRGFALESLVAVKEYAFKLGYESVMANVTQPNLASSRVLENSKFTETMREVGSIVIGNIAYTNVSYSCQKP